MRLSVCLAGIWLMSAFGQVAAPTFEVAAIRPAHPDDPASWIGATTPKGGQFRASGVSLEHYVALAFVVSDQQVRGPKFMRELRFDIQAKVPDTVDRSSVPDMLRQLLVQRFGMQRREGDEEVRGLEMTIQDLTKLTPAEPSAPSGFDTGPSQIRSKAISMDKLAELIRIVTEQPVRNNTGVSGRFAVNLRWSDESGAVTGDLPASLPAALSDLGIRLVPKRVSQKIVIVNSINRQPSGN